MDSKTTVPALFYFDNLREDAERRGTGRREVIGMACQFYNNEDKRKYAYEKAIEAYWHHVNRYHIWMNYYALFNGALFVGFCTLLTATTKITYGENRSTMFRLENDYCWLLLVLCLMGLFSSICWKHSLEGHSHWMKNWMNIIEYYEDPENPVYKLLIVEAEAISNSIPNGMISYRLPKNTKFAKSTTMITSGFICSVNIGWFFLLIYFTYLFFHQSVIICINCLILFFSIFMAIIIFCVLIRLTNGGSDVSGKIWKVKE